MPNTEFSKLKKVIVGKADMAVMPDYDISLHTVCYADKPSNFRPPTGRYPKQVIDEANEDLENFVRALKDYGTEVFRPDYSQVPEYHYYCPRDVVLSYKDMLIAAPTPIKSRRHEYRHVFDNKKATEGKRLVDLTSEFDDDFFNIGCLQNKDVLALKETAPAFEAANILRHYDNLFYLVSNSGNKSGARLLQEIVGHDVKVHLCEHMYSFMHIDSTITILRDGLILVNPSRIKTKEQLPDYFKNWEIVWCPDPIDIGHFPGYCQASPWCNMNLLSLDENTVVVEENQTNLISLLKTHGIESIPLACRHARTLGGCWHCCTLDLERKDV
jgi:N-dimethylarginine dimethylaminohydrolase